MIDGRFAHQGSNGPAAGGLGTGTPGGDGRVGASGTSKTPPGPAGRDAGGVSHGLQLRCEPAAAGTSSRARRKYCHGRQRGGKAAVSERWWSTGPDQRREVDGQVRAGVRRNTADHIGRTATLSRCTDQLAVGIRLFNAVVTCCGSSRVGPVGHTRFHQGQWPLLGPGREPASRRLLPRASKGTRTGPAARV